MFIAAHNGARIWGGAERATARLLGGLQGRGHRVLLFCNRPLVAERAAEAGVPSELQPIGGDVALPHALRFAVRLRRDRPDALIIGTYKKLFLASLGARLAGVPRVVARVGLETDTPRSAKYRFALPRWVSAVVVNAERIRSPFVALPGYGADRVVVIPNGVQAQPPTLPCHAARAALGLPLGVPIVGAVARLDVQKRLDQLLRAVAELGAGTHCVLAGDGRERAALEALAAELGVSGRVHFLGHREDTHTVLAALDLMVVSSDREGMSNSMLEAMAAGVPVVSTPVSGAEDALSPLADGRRPGVVLVGFGEDELAAALRALLADRDALRQMGGAARERAQAEFGFDRMLDRWEAVLSGRPAPAAPTHGMG